MAEQQIIFILYFCRLICMAFLSMKHYIQIMTINANNNKNNNIKSVNVQ